MERGHLKRSAFPERGCKKAEFSRIKSEWSTLRVFGMS